MNRSSEATPHTARSLTLYRGATIDDQVDGMYSFVPARRADEDGTRFARPPIELPGVINPKNSRAARGVATRLSDDVVRDHWDDVRRQVLDAGVGIAVRLDTPMFDPTDNVVPPVSGSSCGPEAGRVCTTSC